MEPSRAKTFIDTHKDRKTKDKKKIDEESARAVVSLRLVEIILFPLYIIFYARLLSFFLVGVDEEENR